MGAADKLPYMCDSVYLDITLPPAPYLCNARVLREVDCQRNQLRHAAQITGAHQHDVHGGDCIGVGEHGAVTLLPADVVQQAQGQGLEGWVTHQCHRLHSKAGKSAASG